MYSESSRERDLEHAGGFPRSITAPSILGLYAFAIATFIVGTNMAGWYGAGEAAYVIPFVAAVSGLAQLLAGVWTFRGRDPLATAFHGTWGAFWIGYGLLFFFFAAKTLPMQAPGYYVPMGYWFAALAVITCTLGIAAIAQNIAFAFTLFVLCAGAALSAVGYFSGYTEVMKVGGWGLLLSALCAWYTSSGMLFQSVLGHDLLPLGKRSAHSLESGTGEPAPIRSQ